MKGNNNKNDNDNDKNNNDDDDSNRCLKLSSMTNTKTTNCGLVK